MSATPSLKSISPNEFGFEQARHLLNRAGFGGTGQQIKAVADMGLDKAVDLFIDYEDIDQSGLATVEIDPDIIRPTTTEERNELRMARRDGDEAAIGKFRQEQNRRRAVDRRELNSLEQWWLARIIESPRPLEEKLTLLWHDHFAVRHRNVRDTYLLQKQNEMFRENANGSFADLARNIVRDPAMLAFLNNDRNRKEKPNENLARELMELFTLGEGNYTEQDIKQGARALTGYTYDDNEFKIRMGQHDNGEKTILGQTGTFNGDAFVDILLKHDACPKFVAYKIYNHFVLDTLDHPESNWQGIVNQIALLVKQHDYELKPTLRAIFKSRHFYDPHIVGNKIKSPAQFLAGTARSLVTPTRDMSILTDAMEMMGQKLFEPPSVAGWDEGRAWVNTSTLFVRQNTASYLLTGKLPVDDQWTKARINYDPTFLIEDLPTRTPEAVTDHLAKLLLSVPISSDRRNQMISFANQHGRNVSEGTLLGMLLLITAMPEYQLC